MRADKSSTSRMLKTARGQIDGILKMIEEDRYCIEISDQLLATQAILRRVNRDILLAHLNGCVRMSLTQEEFSDKIDEIISVVDKLSK